MRKHPTSDHILLYFIISDLEFPTQIFIFPEVCNCFLFSYSQKNNSPSPYPQDYLDYQSCCSVYGVHLFPQNSLILCILLLYSGVLLLKPIVQLLFSFLLGSTVSWILSIPLYFSPLSSQRISQNSLLRKAIRRSWDMYT